MPITSKLILQPLAITLCAAIAQGQDLPTRTELVVVVVQGEGAVNKIRRRSQAPPVVIVRQASGEPVSGAAVVFTLPTEGATGDFDGEKTLILTTDRNGRAAPKTMRLNAIPGKVPIHVSASYRGLTARTVINQVTVVPPGEKPGKDGGKGHGALIAVLLSIGAAAGGGAAYALRQQKTQQPVSSPVPAGPTPIGITPGTATIAGGR